MFQNAHNQPGRRFGRGSNRDDQLLGLFGFLSHTVFFIAITSVFLYYFPQWILFIMCSSSTLAIICLVIRGLQVGSSTTKESIGAIKDAWFKADANSFSKFDIRNQKPIL